MALAGKRSVLNKAHYKYLSAQPKGVLKWDALMPDQTEYFEFISAGKPNQYYIKSSFGKYVCAEKGPKAVADRDTPSEWETFTVEPQPGVNQYAIKTYQGLYFSAQSKGTIDIDRKEIAAWEVFTIRGPSTSGSIIDRQWVKIEGPKLSSISGTGKTIVGRTDKGEAHQFFGGAWSLLPEKFKSIAVAFDQTIVGIDTKDKVRRFEKNKTFSDLPFVAKETPVQIAAQNYNTIVVVTKEKSVYKWSKDSWEEIKGPKFVQISIGEDGSIWTLTDKFEPYRLNPSGSWENVPGSLDQISVRNKSEIVGNNKNDEVFYLSGSKWERMEGNVKWLSLGTNLWGVTAAGTIWTR